MPQVRDCRRKNTTGYLEQLAMEDFDHLIHFDSVERRLVIHRVATDGSRHLFTYLDLPQGKASPLDIERLASKLGESILIDSPTARRILDI